MSAETFSYKGISAGKYIEGEIEALNQEEASFKLKEQKVIITNLTKVKKKKAEKAKKKGGGFSFGKNGPLDMRMSKNGVMAEEVVNQFSEFELANIFYKLGEERKSRQIAREIVRCREKAKISSTLDLAQIIESVIPSNAENRIPPATRCFQALRIYINHELEELEKALHAAQEALSIGGFLIVISFHSLEDRIVKNFLRNSSVSYPKSNRYYPDFNRPNPTFEIVTKKPMIASKNERKNNPRASSAKCRIAIRNDHSNHLKEGIEKLWD